MSTAVEATQQALLERVVAAYAMTDTDKAKFTHLLVTSYFTAKVTAYRRAEATASPVLRLAHPWQPSAHDATEVLAQASAWVESIASTYADAIRRIASDVLKGASSQASDVQARSLIGGLITAAAAGAGIAGGIKAFVTWKAPQIANVTIGAGTQAGTSAWVADVLAERESGTLDVSGNPNGVRVRVLPKKSSSDACRNYAGNDYSLEESVHLPRFPLHLNCPHEMEVYVI